MKQLFCTFTFLFFALIINAQEYKNSETEILEITTDSDATIRKIFQKIADGNRQSVSSLRHKIEFEKTIRWVSEGRTGGKYHAKIEIRAENQASNLEYRQFSIEQSLIPNFIACEVWDKSTSSKKLLKTFKILECRNGNYYQNEFDFSYLTLAKNLKLTIENIEPHYNSVTESQVQKRINQIDSYYQESESLQRFQHILDRLNLNNLDEIEENGEKLTRIKRKIRETDRLKSELNLTQNDPARLLPALRRLQITYDVLEKQYNQINEKRHILYYENGRQHLQRGRTSEAIRLLELAVRHEPNYAPAQLALARLELQRGNLDNSLHKIQNLRRLRNNDPQTNREIRLFYGDVYDRYLQRAEIEQNRRNYDKAMNDYAEAKEIANFLNDSNYEREVERKIRTLKNDQFAELLGNATNELGRHSPNLEMAFRALHTAENFQQNNRQYIDNQRILQQNYAQIYQKSLRQIDEYLQRKTQAFQFRNEIAECLNIAEKTCSKTGSQMNCRADLQRVEGKIKTTEAEVMVSEAEKLMNQENYLMAHKMLWEVENYIQNHQNWIQKTNLTERSWRRYFNHNFQNINQLIQEKNFDLAISDLESLTSDLQKLPKMNLETEILAQKAYAGKYNRGLAEVKTLLQSKNYQSAYQELTNLERFQDRHKKYLLDLKKSEIRQSYIAVFQGLIQNAKHEIRNDNFESALSNLKLADMLLNYQPTEKQTLKKLEFEVFFGSGQQSAQKMDYEKAVKNYENAKKITFENIFANHEKLKQNIENELQTNVLKWIDENTLRASRKINPDEIQEAEKLANQNQILLEKYNFRLSDNLSKKQAELWKNIRAEQCQIAKSELKKNIETAKNQIENQAFSEALTTLQNTISETQNITACKIGTDEAEKLVQKYADAGTYQKMMNTVQNSLQNFDNQEFTENYLKAENYFEVNNVQKFGLKHTDFRYFVLENGANDLLHFLAIRYGTDDLKFTKMLLNKLASRGYGKHSLRNLGRAMAEKDFVKYGDSNPKKIVEKYKFSNSAFRQFRKGYLEAWKG